MDKVEECKKISRTLGMFFSEILENFYGKYNTPETRKKLKNKFENVCGIFKNGELIENFLVICDESNNTPYLIDLRLV